VTAITICRFFMNLFSMGFDSARIRRGWGRMVRKVETFPPVNPAGFTDDAAKMNVS
jgi:hypothetical protein